MEHIHGKAYLLEDMGNDVNKIIATIEDTVNEKQIVNAHVEDKLKDIYKLSLQYLDTPRDKQVLKGVIYLITSVNFTAKLEGVKSRHCVTAANKKLELQLQRYHNIQQTSLTVRSDLTLQQQHQLKNRIVYFRKLKK